MNTYVGFNDSDKILTLVYSRYLFLKKCHKQLHDGEGTNELLQGEASPARARRRFPRAGPGEASPRPVPGEAAGYQHGQVQILHREARSMPLVYSSPSAHVECEVCRKPGTAYVYLPYGCEARLSRLAQARDAQAADALQQFYSLARGTQ